MPSRDFSPKKYFQKVVEKWWILFLAMLIGGLIGVGLSFLKTPRYEAEARISTSIDYTVLPELEDYEEDRMINEAGWVMLSDAVLENVQSKAEEQGISLSYGEMLDTFYPSDYMTFLSDASYLPGDDLLRILNIFNYVPPLYPNVRQVYNDTYYDGYPLVTEENPGTTYDYQIEEGLLEVGSAGCLFNYYPNVGRARGSIHFEDDQRNTATVFFEGDQDSVQRVIIRRPALPAKAKAPNPLPIGGIR